MRNIFIAILAAAAVAISFNVTAGPNGKTDAQKAAIEAQRAAAAAAANPAGAAAKQLARNYDGVKRDVSTFSTDDLKYILQNAGDEIMSPLSGAINGANVAARVNDAYVQGGFGQGANTQPGSPASTFSVCGTPTEIKGYCYTPTAQALQVVREYQEYKARVAAAKEAAAKSSAECAQAIAAGRDGKRVQRKCQ